MVLIREHRSGEYEMELITLCVAAIVVFGIWVELEPVVKSFVSAVSRIRTRNSVRPMLREHKSGLA